MTQAFNLSQLANFVNTSGQLNAATGLFNQVPVANGGTGKSSVTSGALLLGAGTSAMTELAGTTPGTVVTSSPTGWVAAPGGSVAGGNYVLLTYTTPQVYTKPASVKSLKITVLGGGGNGGSAQNNTAPAVVRGGGGGSGGAAIRYLDGPAITTPVTITAGAGTNSFGPFVSATGGTNGGNALSSGTATGAGGSNGVGISGAINVPGYVGYPGGGVPALNFDSVGADSAFGFGWGGYGPGAAISNGNAGAGYGSGGGGARRGPTPGAGNTGGAAGAPGIVIVEEFY